MRVKQLVIYSVLLFVFLTALNFFWVQIAPVPPHGGFFLTSNILFFVLLLFTFLLAQLSLNTKNPTLFLTAFMGSISLKFLAALMVIGIYHFMFQPQDYWYLAPFFFMFVCYKALELFGMMQLNKKSSPAKTKET